MGELLIDMFPAEIGRRLVEVSAFYPKPGGAPANVAVAGRRRYVNFQRHPHAEPVLDRYQALVVLGGPMHVTETDR
ncbi:MAG: hypothetical protein R6X18_14945, partial [Chloroflexota bacterium]